MMLNRRKIREGYDLIQPTYEQKEWMLESILTAASETSPAGKETIMKRKNRRPWMVATLAALMLLLVGCTAVVLKLSDMKIGEDTYVKPAYFDENGEKVAAEEISGDVISLQGIAGSDNQKAAQEWLEFEQSYDQNYEILAVSDDYKAPSEYDAYFVYSQEMIDKVDEIAAKYNLQLMGKIAYVQRYQKEVFFDALNINSLFRDSTSAELTNCSGYFYESANFNLDFDFLMTVEGFQWDHEIWASIRYIDKEYFDTVYCTLWDAETAKQWNYTLTDGTDVLIASTGEAAWIFCDREDAFLSVHISTNWEYEDGTVDSMTERDIELIAETVDFRVKPQMPNMENVEKQLAESEAEYQAEQDVKIAAYTEPWVHDSYGEYISSLLDNMEKPELITYGLADVNNDGVEDLLLGYLDMAEQLGGDEDCFIEVYTIKNGETAFFFTASLPTYLCEGYALESCNISEHAEGHGYYTLGSDYDSSTMELEKFEYVGYYEIDETWRYSNISDVPQEVITMEEAKNIMDTYVRIPIDMKPISEFSMD